MPKNYPRCECGAVTQWYGCGEVFYDPENDENHLVEIGGEEAGREIAIHTCYKCKSIITVDCHCGHSYFPQEQLRNIEWEEKPNYKEVGV